MVRIARWQQSWCVRNPLYKTQIQFQSNCELKSDFYSNYRFVRFVRFNLVLDIYITTVFPHCALSIYCSDKQYSSN